MTLNIFRDARLHRIIACGAAVLTANTSVAWHESHLGQDVTVHYVHLTGHSGDNAINRKLLIAEHEACVRRNNSLGKTSTPMSPDSVPAVPRPQHAEIYYGENRTMTVMEGQIYHIDFDTCALLASSHHVADLHSSIGRCNIDLVKGRAHGQCDSTAHRTAPAKPLLQGGQQTMTTVDMTNVPPSLQAQVQAQLEKMKQPSGAPPAFITKPAGSKTIIGLTCSVYRLDSVNTEKCIARPKSDFAIPTSPMNFECPGLLLEAKSPSMTLLADDVRLRMPVSEGLFSIPPGVDVVSQTRGKK